MVSASSKVDPAQDTAKPISKAGGASAEIYLRMHRGRRRVQKECEIAGEHQGQKRRCSMVGQALHHCQGTVWPVEGTHTPRSTYSSLEGLQPMDSKRESSQQRIHARAQENHEEEGAAERNLCVLRHTASPPQLAATLRRLDVTRGDNWGGELGRRDVGMKMSLGRGEKRWLP